MFEFLIPKVVESKGLLTKLICVKMQLFFLLPEHFLLKPIIFIQLCSGNFPSQMHQSRALHVKTDG